MQYINIITQGDTVGLQKYLICKQKPTHTEIFCSLTFFSWDHFVSSHFLKCTSWYCFCSIHFDSSVCYRHIGWWNVLQCVPVVGYRSSSLIHRDKFNLVNVTNCEISVLMIRTWIWSYKVQKLSLVYKLRSYWRMHGYGFKVGFKSIPLNSHIQIFFFTFTEEVKE